MNSKLIVAGVAVLALALSSCSGKSEPNNTANTNPLGLSTAGTLVGCGDAPFPPFEMEDSSSPTGYTGFDVDLLSAITDKLGLKYSYKDIDFASLPSALVSGQCDVAASSVTITEKRKESLGFSDPYYDSLQSLLVPASSSIASLADLSGKKVGVQSGTTGEIYAKANVPADATIVSFPSDGEEWLAMQAGSVDALLQDFPVNHEHEKADAGYKVVAKFNTDEQLGFAVAKANTALVDALNTQLAALKADGSYDKLYNTYFG